MRKVDKQLEIPLHLQLSTIIREMIDIGELQPGDSLMSERDICKLQGISRMTVNKAILNLVNEGLLDRQQGRGTFVALKKQKHRYQRLEGLTQIIKQQGLEISNQILEFDLGERSQKVQKKLKMDQSIGYKIKRIRYIDQDPVVLETVYLNPKICPHLTRDLVQKYPLYQLYKERYNYKIIRAEQIITPIMLAKEEAKLLNEPKNTLALKIDRIVYTIDEEVMEYTVSIFMSNKHDFEIVLHED